MSNSLRFFGSVKPLLCQVIAHDVLCCPQAQGFRSGGRRSRGFEPLAEKALPGSARLQSTSGLAAFHLRGLGPDQDLGATKNYILCVWDPYQRAWNDVKGAAKRAVCKLWRAIPELCLLLNLSYGPLGTSQFHYKKRACLENFLATETFAGSTWAKFQSIICQERRMSEPTRPEDAMQLFDSLAGLENFVSKGALVKLMRWFSVFEACCQWDGDFFATKMILQSSKLEDVGADADIVDPNPLEQQQGTDKEQLAALKKRAGTWGLAPRLITEALVSKKDILLSVGRAVWKMHAERARMLKTPAQVCNHYIAAAEKHSWKAELLETVENSLWRQNTLQHLVPQRQLHPDVISWHVDFFTHLLELRAMSLASFYCLPPFRYSQILSETFSTAKCAHDQARKEFAALLTAESANAGGGNVPSLKYLYWSLNPLVRAVYLAHEQDEVTGLAAMAQGAAHRLHTLCAETYGDSRLVENSHQHGRDLLRSSTHESFGLASIFANTLRSGALEEREIAVISASNADKAGQNSSFRNVGMKKLLSSRGYKLARDMQQMMEKKKRSHTWPSPGPSGLFQSVAATDTWGCTTTTLVLCSLCC